MQSLKVNVCCLFIERAGGYTSLAYPLAAVFTKERVRHIQQNCLEKVATRIEREPLAKSKHKDATQRLLQQMRAFTVPGRIKASVASQDMPQDRAFDIELENGDSFHIPSLPDTVNVVGAVKGAGVCATREHNGQSDFMDYVKTAGGFTAIADEPAVFVSGADGSMRDVSKAFVEWSRKATKRMEFGGSKYSRQIIEPGDTIVVPDLIIYPPWLRDMRDSILILMNNGIVPPYEVQKKLY